MKTTVRMLYIEDDDLDRNAFVRMVRAKNLPYDLTVVGTLADARTHLAESRFDIIIADYHLPDGHSTELFAEVSDTPFVLMTGTLDEQLALRTLERGADDYLPKDRQQRHLEAVPFTVDKTLHRKQLRDRERQLTRQLRESEAKVRIQAAALEAAPNSISLSKTDPEGTIVWVNHAFTTLTGYSQDEAVGQTHRILHSGRQDAAFYRDLWQTLLRGEVWRGELINRRKDGTLYYEEMAITPLRDEHGDITHFVAIKQDITKRKHAEEALRQSEERLRLLVESVKDYAIYTLDRDGRVVTWNIGAQRLTGWKAEDILGHHYSAFFTPEDLAAAKPQQELEVAAREGSIEQQTRRLRKDGSTFWADITLTALKDQLGDLIGFGKVTHDITKRKLAEEKLRRSEQKFRLIFQQAAIGIGLVRFSDARWIDVNEPFCHSLGYTKQFMLATPWPQITHPDDVDLDLVPFRRMAAGEIDSYTIEKRYLHADGHHVWCRLTLSLVRDPEGRPDYEIAIIENITARKQAEHKLRLAHQQLEQRVRERTADLTHANDLLRQSNERLTKVLQVETVGVMFWDLNTGHMVDANDAFLNMMGYSREDVQERRLTWQKLTPPEYMVVSEAEIRKFLTSGRVGPYEKEYLRKDGTRQWLLFAGSSLGHNQCVEFCVDISARKKAEEALRQGEERFRTLADNISQLAWMTNADGWIFWYNHRWFEYTGTTLEQMQGWGWQAVQHPEHVERVTEGFKAALRSGEPWEDTFPLRGKDGQYRWFLSRALPIRDAQGQVVRWFGTNTDITQQKQAEEEVRRLNANLQEMVAELEHFSYTITHDLRAPLRAMRGLAGVLVEECASCLHGEQREYLQRIADSADRMDQLITDSLQYSTVVRGQFDLEPLDADALLQGILESYPQFQPPRAQVQIDNRLPVVLANKAGLTQCFSNLLNNAVKFVHPGRTPQIRVWAEQAQGNEGEVTRQANRVPTETPAGSSPLSSWHIPEQTRLAFSFESQQPSRMVRIWFEDQGIGIEKEYHDRIWVMFQRLNKSYGGTGIGLALVRKAVERMGGRVGVESEPGKGSRFWVELQSAEHVPDQTHAKESAHNE